MGSLEGLYGQTLNLVSIVQATKSTVKLTLLFGTIVTRSYLPNIVGTHLELSIMSQIVLDEIIT